MARKNHYYVLVFTNEGPKYVTGTGEHHMAYWNELGEPKEFAKSVAEDMVFGLRCNWYQAVLVTTPVELKDQPYNYEDYKIEWKLKEDDDEE